MMAKRHICSFCLVIGMLGLSMLTTTGIDLKPDVHLTLHLEEEKGALILEVPSILPKSWIEKFKESASDNLGMQLDIVTIQRESIDFLAFTIEFESLTTMRHTLTRPILPGIMGSELLPGVFDVFDRSFPILGVRYRRQVNHNTPGTHR